MEQQSDLEHVVTMSLVAHYEKNSLGLVDVIKQLLSEGLEPATIETIVKRHCPPTSVVAAHAYLLAVHYASYPKPGKNASSV